MTLTKIQKWKISIRNVLNVTDLQNMVILHFFLVYSYVDAYFWNIYFFMCVGNFSCIWNLPNKTQGKNTLSKLTK